jgi:hypothetical protein
MSLEAMYRAPVAPIRSSLPSSRTVIEYDTDWAAVIVARRPAGC